jgi:hypothetical protein
MKTKMSKLSPEQRRIQEEKRKIVRGRVGKFILAIVVVALIAGGAIFFRDYQNPVEEEAIIPIHAYAGGEDALTMEDDDLLFTMDPLTTQFEVKVKSSGKVWRSNPENAADDTSAQPEERAKLQSTLLMSYGITSGLETTFSSYGYSVENGIYEISKTDDGGIRVDYSLGDIEKEYVIPPVITKDRFDAFCDKMDKKGANLVQQYYKKYDINHLKKKDNKEQLLTDYPILADEVIYVLRDTTKETTRKTMQGVFEDAGYTYEDYTNDKALSFAEKTSDKPIFNASMIYRLDGGDLTVEVPFDSLEYKEEYPMYTLTVLPYFGAGGKDEEGFMVVPEGGGSLIRWNNGKTAQSSYYTNLYGWDMCLGRDAVVHNTRANFGLFGVSDGKDSFNCELENGCAYASIEADVSGKNHSYNFVNASYSICSREKYDVGDIANSDIYQYLDTLPEGETISQRYHFVDSGDYVDMAKAYGSYLDEKYPEAVAPEEKGVTPVEIELVGAIDKVHQIAGVPVSRPLKLTSYEEAGEIIRDLKESGFGPMVVKYEGWCNGGIRQEMLGRIRLVKALGSSKDFRNMVQTAKDNGAKLYLNGITDYALHSNLGDGFFSYRDAAKFISKERAELYEYSPVTYAERESEDSYYLLHPDLRDKMAGNLNDYAARYGTGVSYENLGSELSSDFYRKKRVSRQAMLCRQREVLQQAVQDGIPVITNQGSDYALPYSSLVTNMDLRGNEYTILDECIPFYQIAVHGRTSYTGEPINLCGDAENEVLSSAEYGAGLSFAFMEESAFATQKTEYPEFYGASYHDWKERALEIYTRYNEELSGTFGQAMTGHRNLSPTLSVTEYEDGTKVYVNYGYEEADADGVSVPARDYLVQR